MGGAAGHMAHPYDLDWVNSGRDLLRFFELAKDLQGTVKIDGVNVSFKLVGDDSNKQFAVDRGSMKNIDIEGITIDRVEERFPIKGHGMRRMIPILLSILNEGLPDIIEELKDFGMYDDPSKFLNTEFVESKPLNVMTYDKNFLAIHGLNQFYERVAKSGPSKGNVRPGLSRPEDPITGRPTKAPSVEIPYSDTAMNAMVEKLDDIAKKYGFDVINEAPTVSKGDPANYSDTLSKPLTIKLTDDREITKPLSEWLGSVQNPRYATIKLKNGKVLNALHRQLYVDLVEKQIPVYDLMDEQYASDAISGAVMVHATRHLGNDILDAYTSMLGDLRGHEGIVLRNKEKFRTNNPVKVTGDFIIGNLAGGFGDIKEEIDLDIDTQPKIENIIMIYPGRFQPMGKHHAGVYKELARRFGEENTFIATTNKVAMPKSPLNFVEKLKVINKHGIKNVVNVKNPYKAEEITKRFDPETTAVLFAVGDKDMRESPRFRIGVKKDGSPSYFQNYEKSKGQLKPYTEHGYLYVAPHVSFDVPGYGEMSGTVLRQALANASKDEFEEIMGFFDPDIYNMLKEKFGNLQEMSSMAGGAVAGYAAPLGSTSGKKKKKRKPYYDEGLIDEVYDYLIKQGFLK